LQQASDDGCYNLVKKNNYRIKMKPVWTLIKQTVIKWDNDNASWLAAALAYYTIFSMAPLIIIIIAVMGFLFGEQAVQGEIQEQLRSLIGNGTAKIIEVIIRSASKSGSGIIATIIGMVVLLFGATNVFTHLQGTMDKIWQAGSQPGRTWFKSQLLKRLVSISIIMGIGLLLFISIMIDTLLVGFHNYITELLPGAVYITLIRIINHLISFAIVTALFAVIYKTIPTASVVWHDAWAGALFTAVLFIIGKLLINLYLSNSWIVTAFGAAGSVIVILFWFYYSAQILFLGAEFTYVYSQRRR
jgi:membrane protein